MSAPDAKQRFTSRAADYVAGRPMYPIGVISVLRQHAGWGPPPSGIVADIGAGTGISSELFLKQGYPVIVVEPNDAMRTVANERLSQYPLYSSVSDSAENTTLADRSVDLVMAAQAYHWFDRQAFKRECGRIARQHAWLLLMWNERLATGSAFAEQYEQLLLDYSTDYTRVDHRQLTPEQIAEPFAEKPARIDLPNEQRLDYETLLARLRSSSYTPAPDHPRYDAMIDMLKAIYDRTQQNGFVTMEYRTELHLGRINQT